MSACLECGAALAAGYPASVCAACLWGEGAPAFTSVAGHEILAEIARGGMGVVYRAREPETQRTVALKMLRPGLADARGMRERFRLEARAVAALDHPGILPVYRVDEADEMPFFTMKLATGGTLAARRDALRGKWRAIAALVADLADALHFAHQHGVLHRDVKPANVLFDDADRCYLGDFGLAKLVGDTTALTATTGFLGTPHYAAPEVAEANAGAATIASDVWSLGAVLHELLGARPPFDAPGIPALLRAIVDAAPAPLPAEVPRDLGVVADKCLVKTPASRYASAAALAADLRAWLDGRPIAARPMNAAERALAWARRHPAIAALTFSLLVVLVALGVSLVREVRASRLAEKGARMAAAEALLEQARALRRAKDPAQLAAALAAATRSAQLRPTTAARDEVISLLAGTGAVCTTAEFPLPARFKSLNGERREVIAWPDGKRFAMNLYGDLYIIGREGGIESTLALGTAHGYALDPHTGGGVWHDGTSARTHERGSAGGRVIAKLKAPVVLALHAPTRRLFAGDYGGITTWTLGAEAAPADFGLPANADTRAAAWSPDGRLLAWSGTAQEGSRRVVCTRVLDVEQRREVAELSGEKSFVVSDLAFTADGALVLAAGTSAVVAFDAATGAPRWSIEAKRPGSLFARVATTPGVVAVTITHETIALLDPATGETRRTLAHPRAGAVLALAFSPDGQRLAVLAGSTAQVWRLDAMEAELRARGL